MLHLILLALASAATAASTLKISLQNSFGGSLNAYVTGQDTSGKAVMLSTDGSWYYPQSSGSSTPSRIQANVAIALTGQTTVVTLPDYLISGRIYVANGTLQFSAVTGADGKSSIVQPSVVSTDDASRSVNWGFVELTNNEEDGIYANLSFVDWVGLLIGMTLTLGSGETQTVWQKYTSEDLTFNSQKSAVGNITCRVSGDQLTCNGDNRGYSKPATSDIWGCNSGPFAISSGDNDIHKAVVPRLCAAFQRTTLLLSGGNVQPSAAVGSSSYYLNNPTNHYSRIVHAHELDGRGYAFAYDDVNPDGQNSAGVVSGQDPQGLTIMIGGPN